MFTVHRKKKKYMFCLMLVASFTFLLFGCASFSQTEGSQYVADALENVDKTEDADIHSREIEHYEDFLRGEECAYDEGWMFDIDHVVKGSGCTNEGGISKYAYYDSDKDGQLELHVQSSYFYYILQYRNNRLELLKALDIETGSDKIEWTIIPEENGTKNVENDNDAMEHYEAFLMGKECAYAGEETFDIISFIRPTKEPDKHYATRYTYFDSDEDGQSELHIRSVRRYEIITYRNGRLEVWKTLTRDYELLNNGAFLCTTAISAPVVWCYTYVELDNEGNEIVEVGFSTCNTNQNEVCDDEDEYSFEGQEVTMNEWNELTQKYFEIGTDEIEWVTLFAETN